MGRTLPTFTMQLDHEMARWRPLRRALRREDQHVLDRLFALARRHVAEAANAARPVPFDSLVMTILLEQEKQIGRLRERLEAIEGARDDEDRPDARALG